MVAERGVLERIAWESTGYIRDFCAVNRTCDIGIS